MYIESTPLDGLFILNRPIRRDERGFFSRVFDADEIAKAGRPTKAVHVNTSTSVKAGTIRGIHFQYPPYSEAKIVSCTAGAIWDVGIDLRPNSPTQFQWFGATLTPENGKSLIVPEGFGHAFITLEDNSTVIYIVSEIYEVKYESGLRHDDPILGIKWPINPTVLSEKDRNWGFIENRIDEINNCFNDIK